MDLKEFAKLAIIGKLRTKGIIHAIKNRFKTGTKITRTKHQLERMAGPLSKVTHKPGGKQSVWEHVTKHPKVSKDIESLNLRQGVESNTDRRIKRRYEAQFKAIGE